MRTMLCAALLGLLALAAPAAAQAPEPLDYSQPGSWVCRPDAPCRDDLSATVLEADGGRRIETFAPAADPPVDCFYIYPTVSNGPGISAPAAVTEDEHRAVRQQVARLASVCRLYVPLYRQITVTSMLDRSLPPEPDAGPRAQADVLAAWDSYLARDNHGRGVVLIGHSQGAAMIIDLMKREIDGTPLQSRLVSAITPGFFVLAPAGRDVGGTFKTIPACRRAGQIGCVLAWNSYRAEAPIPTEMVIPFRDGLEPICTNPASLSGGAGDLKPYFSSEGETIIPALSGGFQGPWTNVVETLETPFVSLPGLYRAECRHDAHGVWLAVTRQLGPQDPRTGDFAGDWLVGGRRDPTMGLHLLDLNLVQGNLLDLIAAQAAAYAARP